MKKFYRYFLIQVISWLIAYNLLGLFVYIILKHDAQVTGDTVDRFNLYDSLLWGSVGAVIIALLLSRAEYYIERFQGRFKSFGLIILFKSLLYIFLILITIMLGNLIALFLTDSYRISDFFVSYQFLSIFLVSILNSIFLNFFIQVNKKFGQGEMWAVLTGKYFYPREEKRIFMFLDLKSSTFYAEQLGHIRYSRLIQRCFHLINKVVPDYRARLYQYVGDEVVLTWDWKDGLEDNHCVSFYFAFMELVGKNAGKFQSEFGLIPEFKAGLHGGTVTVAEIGDLKREIAYHGDVINTAARLQAKCNELDSRFLVSGEILKHLEVLPYLVQDRGEVVLRGKRKPLDVYSVESGEYQSGSIN